MQYCFGVDVGGTSIKMGLFDIDGNVIDKWEIPTRTMNKGVQILPDIASSIQHKMLERELQKENILGVGLGVPGPVDQKGVVYRCVNLGWDVFNVDETLTNLLGLPVHAGNDANVAALGEMWKGGGVGYKNLVVATLGTGVGGGIIVEGHVLAGANGSGGEIGHIHVQDGEEDVCGCGNKGCLEQYASATGIVRLAKRALESTTKSTILDIHKLSAKSVFDAVKENDEVAIEIANQFGEYLGKGLAAVAGVTNPEAIVIGGGVSKAGDILLQYIQQNYQKFVFHGSKDVQFKLATLENDAGIFGAARLVLD